MSEEIKNEAVAEVTEKIEAVSAIETEVGIKAEAVDAIEYFEEFSEPEEPDYVIHKLSETDHPEANQEVFFHLKKGGDEKKGVFKRFSAVHLNGAHFLVDGVRFYMHEVDTWHE